MKLFKDHKDSINIINVAIVFGILLAVIITGLLVWEEYNNRKEELKNYVNYYEALEEEVNENEIGNKAEYSIDNKELYYKAEDQSYTVYISENNKERVLIEDVLYDASGGSYPVFSATGNPSVVLLSSFAGDMGGFRQEHYYIDLDSDGILKIVNTKWGIEINSDKLTLEIEDNCGMDEDRVEGGTAYLKSILVNNVPNYIYEPSQELFCINPQGLGSIYNPQVGLKFLKVDLDRSKVYFSAGVEGYAFNINDSSITKSAIPSLSLSDSQTYVNPEYGFKVNYPRYYIKYEGTGIEDSNFPWYEQPDFLLFELNIYNPAYEEHDFVNIRILNTIDNQKIAAAGGYESIDQLDDVEIDGRTFKVFSIDKGASMVKVLTHNELSYVFTYVSRFEYLFNAIINTFEFINN